MATVLFWQSIHQLSWSMRVSYVFLLIAAIVNLRDAFESAIEPPWRRMYAYKGLVAFLAWLWYTLLLIGLVTTTDFIFAVRWLQPLIVSGLMTSALLHRWEIKNLREKQRQQEVLKAALEREDHD